MNDGSIPSLVVSGCSSVLGVSSGLGSALSAMMTLVQQKEEVP